MAGLKAKVSRKQEEAIVALLSQRSIEEAARACGTPVRTLYRWLKEPEFHAAYRVARRQAYGQSISRLQQGSTAAATTLLKTMLDPNSPPSCRLRAADSVLSHAAKVIEIEDIEARVAELERAAAEVK
jgi:Helix-turn-helix of insertion element transposase